MFKNLFIYRIANIGPIIHTMFAPCGPTQERSFGWVSPRDIEHAPSTEDIDGQWIMKMAIETKSVPRQVIERKLDEACASVELMTGRKPGKKERREMRENVLLELLPSAFAKRVHVWVWIDVNAKLLVVDTPSQARADLVVTDLIQSSPGLAVAPLVTQLSPAALMTSWLLDGDNLTDFDRFGFSPERHCELKSADEEKSVVKFARHNLMIDEIRDHIKQGKYPTSLALTWNGRVSFVLTHAGQLRKVTLLDIERDERDDAFDAEVTLFTRELRKMIPDLIEALGGLAPQPVGQ